MSLLKEFAALGDTQADLKSSDGSDAGKNDVKKNDVVFNLLRNTINTDKNITGSDVNDYLERAHELNDQVETVGFAIEDKDGQIIKVYVNALEADQFESEMANMLGLDDDIESAINQAAQKFDIVDVVWPTPPADGSDAEAVAATDADLTLDSEPDAFSLENPVDHEDELDNALPADDEEDERPLSLVKSVADDAKKKDEDEDEDELDVKIKKSPSSDASDQEDGEEDGEESADDLDAEDSTEDSTEDSSASDEEDKDVDGEEVSDEEELEPVLNVDGSQKLDKDGNPVMRKKKKEKAKKEDQDEDTGKDGPEITEEGVKDEVLAHANSLLSRGNKGKFYIEQVIKGIYGGPRKKVISREGKPFYFTSRETALQEAERLSKQKNWAGATASYKYDVRMVESVQKGDYMIGSKFLERVAEAEDVDGIKDGLNIPLDSQQRLLASRLKRPLEKQIIGLFAMAGIWGRLLAASDGVEDSVRAAADSLRKSGSTRRAFNEFYVALGRATGHSLQVQEEVISESKLKRGSSLQKRFESVLVALGLPEDLVVTDGPGVLAPALFKIAKVIDADGNLTMMLNRLAVRLGVNHQDDVEPKIEKIGEAVTVADDFANAVVQLALALGIPENNLRYQQSMMLQSIRKKKATLANRSMIEQKIGALAAMVTKYTRQQPQSQDDEQVQEGIQKILAEAQLNEAFGDLEAITSVEMKKYNIDEPNAGPAMVAAYEGAGKHEETMLTIGVDPDEDNTHRNLAVSIDGPWDGVIHRKYFSNDKSGYKAALEYANMLRTCNLKSGGRPKGWKDAPAQELEESLAIKVKFGQFKDMDKNDFDAFQGLRAPKFGKAVVSYAGDEDGAAEAIIVGVNDDGEIAVQRYHGLHGEQTVSTFPDTKAGYLAARMAAGSVRSKLNAE